MLSDQFLKQNDEGEFEFETYEQHSKHPNTNCVFAFGCSIVIIINCLAFSFLYYWKNKDH